jgi:hypothetical protein
MRLVIESPHSTLPKSYPINNEKELTAFVQEFGIPLHVFDGIYGVEEALQTLVEYLSNHHLDAYIQAGPESVGEVSAMKPADEESEDSISFEQEMSPLLGQVWSTKDNEFLEAARFIAGAPAVASDQQIEEARNHCDTEESAALYTYHIPHTEDALKELKAVAEIIRDPKGEEQLDKAEKPPSEPDQSISRLIAVPGKGEHDIMAVNRGIAAGKVTPIAKPGKFSQKAFVVSDPQSEERYIVKPNPHKVAPPKGMSDVISAPVRERAFWDLADALGLSKFLPVTALAIDNNQELCSVVKYLKGYRSIDSFKKETPGSERGILEQYRKTGDLHRWAVLDFIGGSVDRHGNNVWVSDDGQDIKLIDQGSSLADENFDPAADKKSFLPFYLRAWGVKHSMKQKDRLQFMPKVDHGVDQQLGHWIQGIDPKDIRKALEGIPDPIFQAVLGRLKRLMAAILSKEDSRLVCEVVNAAWLGVYN